MELIIMELIQVGSLNEQKEKDIIDLIINHNGDEISIKAINKETGVSYNYIKKIAKEKGYKIEKRPFPSRRKFLCVIK